MNKKILKNYIYNSLYQIILAITPIITIPYKTRIFTSDNLGIYSYIFTVISYVILLGSIGINLYGKREIAYNKDNPKEKIKILYELTIIKTITLLLTSIIFYLTVGIISKYKIYYYIMFIEIIINMYDFTWFLEGIEEFKKISIINIINRILNIIAIFVFLKNNNDFFKYIIITIIFDAIPIIVVIIILKQYIVPINLKNLNIKQHLKTCIVLFIPQICIELYTACDKIMLGILQENISEVGFYEYAYKIIQIILKIVSSITIVMMPIISNEYKKKNIKQIKYHMNKSINYATFISIPLIFGLIATSDNITIIMFGEKYSKIGILLKVLSIEILPVGITSIIGSQYLVATNQEKKFTMYILAGTIINIILNILLINKFSSIGASIATIITEIIILLLEIQIIKEFVNLDEIKTNIIKYIFFALIMSIIVSLIGLINTSLPILIIQIIIGIIIYISILEVTKDKIYSELKNYKLKK